MKNDKIIKDIRFYESNWPNISGNSLPVNPGKIYNLSGVDLISRGQRIAGKLNGLKFVSGSFEYIYINLTTLLKDKQIEISGRAIDKRYSRLIMV